MSGATYTNTFQSVIADLTELLQGYQTANAGSLWYAPKEEAGHSVNTNRAQSGSEESKAEKATEETQSVGQSGTDSSSDSHRLSVASTASAANSIERKSAIPHPSVKDGLVWWAKSKLYDPQLKSAKISIIADLLDQINSEMQKKQNVTLYPIKYDCTKKTQIPLRNKELQILASTLDLLKSYVTTASNNIMAKRGDNPPRAADALLNVVSGMLSWMQEEDNLDLLYTVLGYESIQNNDNQDDSLLDRMERLEKSYVGDLYKWLFAIKLDELRSQHEKRDKQIPDLTAQELTQHFKQQLQFIHRESFQSKDNDKLIFKLKNSIYASLYLCGYLDITAPSLPTTITAMLVGETFLQRLARQMDAYKTDIDAKTVELRQKNNLDKTESIKSRRAGVGVSLTN